MTVEYIIKTTRPSIMHMFWFELLDDGSIFNPTYPVWVKNNLIDYQYDEFVPWDSIFERKSELRTDLFRLCENKSAEELINEGTISPTPPYNPFTLTHTAHLKFESLDKFKQSIDNTPVNIIKDSMLKSENLIVEEALKDAEGNFLSDILANYSLVNR